MNSIRSNLKCHWTCIIRSKFYHIYIGVFYFLLAFFDFKNKVYISKIDDYIYRYNYQQLLIISSVICIVSLIINENFFDNLNKFIRIYILNMYQYFFSGFLAIFLSNIIPFIIGGLIALIFNYIHIGWVPISLFLMNILIVSMELATAIFIAMALNLFIKKNVLVYLIYFIILITLIISNNVYISLPLTMGILDTQGYYTTFNAPLWIGRIFLLIISILLFLISMLKGIKSNH